MHKLRHEANSIKVRTSLEKFICKFNIDPASNYHLIFNEHASVSSQFSETEKFTNELDDDRFNDDNDENYIEEPKKIRGDNEKTLLQIPVEFLPCPAEVKSVTDRTYTYPSQNEAKDYRNLLPSTSQATTFNITGFMLFLLFLCIKI